MLLGTTTTAHQRDSELVQQLGVGEGVLLWIIGKNSKIRHHPGLGQTSAHQFCQAGGTGGI